VVVVPQDAVQTVDGHPSVFVAESGGRFSPRPVVLGAEEGGLVEVTSGVASGERIAVKGGFALKSEWLEASGGQR
jgi:cobalt-zinc-cadmium efflux system membrane fusion protein